MQEKILTLVEKIREKPESTRWVIVGVITIIVSISVIVLWGWSLGRQFNTLSEEEAPDAIRNIAGPFSMIGRTWQAIRRGENLEPIVEEMKKEPEFSMESEPQSSGMLAALREAVGFNIMLVRDTFRDLTR